jgi:hypothetical protein
MTEDHVDHILHQWARERLDLDVSPMGVIGRLSRVTRHLERSLEATFQRHGLGVGGFDVLAALRAPATLTASRRQSSTTRC